MDELKYPVGKFSIKEDYSAEELNNFISEYLSLTKELKEIVAEASGDDLLRTYRPGGWNMMQVVHHIADSQMNALIRMKLALTEDTPTIKPYAEEKWAETPEYKSADLKDSLMIIEAVHNKIVMILKNINPEELNRRFYHPESKKYFTVKQAAALYNWHLKHHLGHIKLCMSERMK